MKIGILTLPIADNYGGILQAVALYRLLDNQGHDVVLIYKKHYDQKTIWKELVKKIILKIPFQDFKNIKKNKKITQEIEKKKAFHRTFIEKEIFKISKDFYTKQELKTFVKEEVLDAVIVGSDQVWRKEYINDKYYKSYFLDFVTSKETKKIAYAASFGKDYWEGENDINDIENCLKDFDAVSTRELSGLSICKNIFSFNNAKHTLDPTILIGKEFYLEMISKYEISNVPKSGLVTYVLDEGNEKKKIIEFLKKKLSIKEIHHLKGFKTSDIVYTVPEWIASFAYADTVITDSFHGMVFSIIFEKKFVVIGNQDRGLDRFISLLSLIGLEDRLIFNLKDLKKDFNNIDYTNVKKILDANKENSLKFLTNALKIKNN